MAPSPCLATVTPLPTPQHHRLLRVLYVDQGQLWLWREETGSAAAFGLQGEAHDACVSPDGRLVAFRRPGAGGRDEVWVVGTDGVGERRLAEVDAWDFGPTQAWLDIAWLADSRTVAYGRHRQPADLGPGECPYGAVWLVDVEGGAPRLVVPEGLAHAIALAPDGRQVAALSEHELHLIDARDGTLVTTAALLGRYCHRQELHYSPDGRYVIAFMEHALAVVDAQDGRRRDIPLDYQPIGMGHYCALPRLFWPARSTVAYALVPLGRDVLEVTGPGASFGLWQVDFVQATASRLRTFRGDGVHAQLSPDGRWLAYWLRDSEGDVVLHLADAQTGASIAYDRYRSPSLLAWHPDSVHLVYQAAGAPPMLGHICAGPLPLGETGLRSDTTWQRLVWVKGRDEFLSEELRTADPAGGGAATLIRLSRPDGSFRVVATMSVSGRLSGYYLTG